jgi:bacillaene synthase trans-acting acyltransferase
MREIKKPPQMTSNHQIVFLFSGQGSQYRGMGENLFKNSSVFAQALDRSDALIQKKLGLSLVSELYSDRYSSFDDLQMTHPAIVSVQLALWSVLLAMGVRPDYVIGSSLGEFAAAAVCGVWSPETAVEAAIVQAQSIVENGEKGGMLAITDIGYEALLRLSTQFNLHIASSNFPGHYTLSGTASNLDVLGFALKAAKIPFLRLPVSYPFHSPLLAGGKIPFLDYMRTILPLNMPSAEFVSGLQACRLSFVPDDYFWDVVSQPFDFAGTVSQFEERGPCLYVDLSPSGSAATFVNYNLPASTSSIVYRIMTPFKREERQLQGLFELLKTRDSRTEESWA